ncbi:MAG: His/Gly/Thr/Pro-type tRNA ligase C-terminal domain-containing protein, partial [Candidatus Kapaibacteriota bacterium]
LAKNIYRDIQNHYKAMYDDSGAIGRRYRRQDEIGTPFCITIDGQSLLDNTVTIRDRDTMKQIRLEVSEILDYLRDNLKL